ncbi:hypothetical protein F8M41_002531 [Gigaspora margarita]|uniref:Uncharacterized protein n=1 Tax=Gigaspora margarita TaxID=4874 RepID=A0A8H4A6Y0_GIGMA|nr:hypothetical protein F8M41_002531 [Gigaspora margarita]
MDALFSTPQETCSLEMNSENVNRFWEMNEETKKMVLKFLRASSCRVSIITTEYSKIVYSYELYLLQFIFTIKIWYKPRTVEFREVYEPELAAPSVTIKKKDEPIMPLAIKRENNSLLEELVVDYNINPNLKAYCEILETLQNHHVEEDSQSARLQQSSFPTSQISLRLVSALFLKHTNDKLHSVVPILKNLITKGKIFDSYVSFETIRRLFDKSKKKCNEIDTLTVASFVPVWEFHHLFPGHALNTNEHFISQYRIHLNVKILAVN